MGDKPFIKNIETNGGYYIYDVNTNNILKVNECLFDIVGEFGNTREEIIIDKFKHKYSEENIKQGLKEINLYREEKGIFSSDKPSKMFFPFSKEETKIILDNLLGQLILNITESCNLRCEYCKYSGKYPFSRSHSDTFMNEDVALKSINFFLHRARSNHLSEEKSYIGFYGGEPLINFKLIKKSVDYVNNNFANLKDKIKFSMTTNMTLLTNEIIDFFIQNDVSLLVSLDGPKSIHDRYRKYKSGEGTFEAIMNNLGKIKEKNNEYYKKNIGYSIVIAPPYDLDLLIDFFGKDEISTEKASIVSYVDPDDNNFFEHFPEINEINLGLNNKLRGLKIEYVDMIIKEEKNSKRDFLDKLFEDRIRDVFRRNLIKLPKKIYPNGICLPGFQRIFVSPSGNFYACEKIGYSFQIGDIYNGFDINGIFDLIDQYKRGSELLCLDCWAVRLCKSCYLRAKKGGQLDTIRKIENCDILKASVERGLKSYCEIMERNPKALDYYKNYSISGGLEIAFKFLEDYYGKKNYS